jgi:hypothetical protein
MNSIKIIQTSTDVKDCDEGKKFLQITISGKDYLVEVFPKPEPTGLFGKMEEVGGVA